MEWTVTFDGTPDDSSKAYDFANYIYKYTEDVVVTYNMKTSKWEILVSFDDEILLGKKEEKRIRKHVKNLHGEINVG